MPLVKRCIEPVFLSRDAVPSSVADELQCVTNATLANVIRQLSSLSEHADDLFGEILRDTELFTTRTHQLSNRVQRLKRSVTQLDSTVEEVLLQEVNSRKQFRSTVRKDAQLFTIESRPKSISDLYAKCDAPPELRKLNEFRDDNYDCMKYYTNPNYFFELWSQETMLAFQQNKEKINKRRKHKRPKNRAPQHIKEAKSKRDEMQRFKHGKELTTQKPVQATPSISTQPHPHAAGVPVHQQPPPPPPPPPVEQLPPQQHYAPHVVQQPAQQAPPPPMPYEAQSINLDLLPPPPPPIEHSRDQREEFQKPAASHVVTQNLPVISQHVTRAPSMMQSARPNCAPPPAPIPKQLPPQQLQSSPPKNAGISSSAPPPPPLPPPFVELQSMAPSTTPSHPIAAPPTSSDRMLPNSLLSQITNVTLNPADEASIASSESSTTGIKLRRVEERKEKDRNQKQKSKILDVQQIMENAFEMRRKALEVDQDNSEDGDNDDDEWSDDE